MDTIILSVYSSIIVENKTKNKNQKLSIPNTLEALRLANVTVERNLQRETHVHRV